MKDTSVEGSEDELRSSSLVKLEEVEDSGYASVNDLFDLDFSVFERESIC